MPTTPKAAKGRPRPRSDSVYDELRQQIDGGRLPPGSRLPSEPELAAELGVSRATLRDALRALEDEGALRRRWGSGTYVAERPRVATSLDLNFGVTEAIQAAGMRLGRARLGGGGGPPRPGAGPGRAGRGPGANGR